jgi:hypothetical protein
MSSHLFAKNSYALHKTTQFLSVKIKSGNKTVKNNDMSES